MAEKIYSHIQDGWGLEYKTRDADRIWSTNLSTFKGGYGGANDRALTLLMGVRESERARATLTLSGVGEFGVWRVVKLERGIRELRHDLETKVSVALATDYSNAPFTAFVSAVLGRKVADASWFSTVRGLTDDEVRKVHKAYEDIYGRVS